MTARHYTILTCSLALLSAVLLLLLLGALGRLNRYRADVQYAHDIVWSREDDRDRALKAEPKETVRYLEQLHDYEDPAPKDSLDWFVERHRRRLVHDLIAHLRDRTGKDLGDNAEAWIKEYEKK